MPTPPLTPLAAAVLRVVPAPERVLEIECGDGEASLFLAREFPTARGRRGRRGRRQPRPRGPDRLQAGQASRRALPGRLLRPRRRPRRPPSGGRDRPRPAPRGLADPGPEPRPGQPRRPRRLAPAARAAPPRARLAGDRERRRRQLLCRPPGGGRFARARRIVWAGRMDIEGTPLVLLVNPSSAGGGTLRPLARGRA